VSDYENRLNLERIEKLSEHIGDEPMFPEDVDTLVDLEDQFKEAAQVVGLYKNPVIRSFAAGLRVAVGKIEETLHTKSFEDEDRDYLLLKRELYLRFYNLFVDAESQLAETKKNIKEQIDFSKENAEG